MDIKQFKTGKSFAKELDAADPLREYRSKFHIPKDETGQEVIYLCGNSLGNFPKLGEVAPDFELDLLGKEQKKLRLSAFRGKKPVMLIFGSFT